MLRSVAARITEFVAKLVIDETFDNQDRFRWATTCNEVEMDINGSEGKKLVWQLKDNSTSIQPITEAAQDIVRGFAKDHKHFIHVVRHDDRATILDDTSGQVIFETPAADSAVSAIALSPAADFLYLGTENRMLRMWSIADHSSPLIDIRAHDSKITKIVLSPDNRSFITTDDAGVIRLWPILSTSELRDRISQTSSTSIDGTPAASGRPSQGGDDTGKTSSLK